MYNLQNCLNLWQQMLTVIHVSWQVLARPRLWIAKACTSHRIGPRNGFAPLLVYYTTRHPKSPCSAVWSSSGGAGKCHRRTCNGLPKSGRKKGATLAGHPFVNYILQAASLIKSSYKRTHCRFGGNRNLSHAPKISSQSNAQEVHFCHRRCKYHMPIGRQNR